MRLYMKFDLREKVFVFSLIINILCVLVYYAQEQTVEKDVNLSEARAKNVVSQAKNEILPSFAGQDGSHRPQIFRAPSVRISCTIPSVRCIMLSVVCLLSIILKGTYRNASSSTSKGCTQKAVEHVRRLSAGVHTVCAE